MSLVNGPFTSHTYSPVAQTEAELAYELLTERVWSDEAYLVFSETFNRLLELSDGQLLVLSMPSLKHQTILLEFVATAKTWLKNHDAGSVVMAPHPIRLWPGKYREPDAMIWLAAHRDRMGERESGLPDLALEIVSPGNEPHDTETKFREYAQAGIPEYWIVQPATQRLSVYVLEGRVYRLLSHFGPDGRARSSVLAGFEIAVDDLFQAE
jgi:Uma2 family endonuclease